MRLGRILLFYDIKGIVTVPHMVRRFSSCRIPVCCIAPIAEVEYMKDMEYIGLRTEVPKILQKILPRRNIIEMIDNSPLDEMIYFVAPYGCGKTMAVMSWLKEHNYNAAWITLSKEDNLEVSFWAYLATAILRVAGEREKSENILYDTHFNTNPRAFLRKTLLRVSPAISDKILIIDNFRFIGNNGFLREIRDFISGMLSCWRVILIGRNELPPIFNDFMLKKHLRLITLSELSFSLEEMNEYFLINDLIVEKKDLLQIHEATDGWPAALNVILAVPHNEAVRYNDNARAYVISYFETEIWEQLGEKIKLFLLKTAILDRLTPSICHYVTDIEETHLLLKNLYVNGIFTSKLAADTYCYHRVFQDFLLEKISVSDIDINSLYIKAGWWLYDSGDSISALRCFHKAKNIYGINMTFKKIRPADMGMEKYLKAISGLEALDIMELKSYPEVAVRIALYNFIIGNMFEVKRIYNIVLEWLEPGALSISPEEYIDFAWEVGWLRYVNPDEDIFLNDRFAEWANVTEYAPHLLENDRSRASALRLPSVLRGARDFSADINGTEEYYNMNIAANQGVIHDQDALFIMDLIMAEIAYERESFHKAEKIIKENISKIEKEKQTELYFICISLLIKISRAVHNAKEIEALTVRLRKMIETNGHLFLLPNFHAFELRNRLVNGIPGVTEVFEKENAPYKDKPYYFLIYRHITYVRALLSEHKYCEANLILGNLDLLFRQYKRNMDLIEVNILRSITEYGLDHEADAYHYLKIALDAGRKCGFIRIFSDDAIDLWPILGLIQKFDVDTYIKKVIISCKKAMVHTGSLIHAPQNMYESLTPKEINILKLLKAGMSYEEIALDSHIKVGTVRTHIHSIYSKLNVRNRTSAVVIAQKNGIIKSNHCICDSI